MRYDECQKLVSATDNNAKPETRHFFARRMFAWPQIWVFFWAARVPHKRDEAVCPTKKRPDKEPKLCVFREKNHEWNVIDCDSVYMAIGCEREVWQRSGFSGPPKPKIIIHFNKYREKNQGRH